MKWKSKYLLFLLHAAFQKTLDICTVLISIWQKEATEVYFPLLLSPWAWFSFRLVSGLNRHPVLVEERITAWFSNRKLIRKERHLRIFEMEKNNMSCPFKRQMFLVFTEQNSSFIFSEWKQKCIERFYPRMTVACNVLATCDKSSLQDELSDRYLVLLCCLYYSTHAGIPPHCRFTAAFPSHTSEFMFFLWNNTLCCMYLSHLKSFKSSWDLLNKTDPKTWSLFKALLASFSWDIQ